MKLVVHGIPPTNNKYLGKSRNFNVYRHEKEEWHWRVKGALNKVKRPKKPINKAVVIITYYFKDKRRRDPDNYSGKMILDPLVREGILADDSFDNIDLLIRKGGTDKEDPRTEIEIKNLHSEENRKNGKSS